MQNNEAGTQISETYDVVIIGGGIAGLYCCHELIKQRELLKINSILLLEASKLAEMDGKPDQKAQFTKEYEVALKRTTELSAAAQKRKEEEARQTASPPKG